MKIGDKVNGKIYGKPELTGTITDIEVSRIEHREIAYIKWNDGQTAMFYTRDLLNRPECLIK
jgi:protein involved in polysaccharide export with SLBB domain